tara:strand:- start:181 stop:528 length:348 start_codon:yes stop_codon:yes gene_type:complete
LATAGGRVRAFQRRARPEGGLSALSAQRNRLPKNGRSIRSEEPHEYARGFARNCRKIAPDLPVIDKAGRTDGTWCRADFEWDAKNKRCTCPAVLVFMRETVETLFAHLKRVLGHR